MFVTRHIHRIAHSTASPSRCENHPNFAQKLCKDSWSCAKTAGDSANLNLIFTKYVVTESPFVHNAGTRSMHFKICSEDRRDKNDVILDCFGGRQLFLTEDKSNDSRSEHLVCCDDVGCEGVCLDDDDDDEDEEDDDDVEDTESDLTGGPAFAFFATLTARLGACAASRARATSLRNVCRQSDSKSLTAGYTRGKRLLAAQTSFGVEVLRRINAVTVTLLSCSRTRWATSSLCAASRSFRRH